jgi:parallel beta-helix repeat protein
VITIPGTYFLNKDLVFGGTGVAITISASDVTVDFQSHTLSFTGANNNGTTGVQAGQSQAVQNVTIENGTIHGFESGISFLAGSDTTGLLSSGHVVEHMRIYSCSVQGILFSRSSGCLIRNNIVNNAKSFSGLPSGSNGYGIIIDGAGNHVVGNQLLFLFAGIYAQPGNISGGLANGNYLERNFESGCNTAVAATFHDKIRFNTTVNCVFRNNGATEITDDNN